MPHVQMCCFEMQSLHLLCPSLQTALRFLEGEALFSTSLLGCIESLLNSVKTWDLVCLPVSSYYPIPKETHNVAHRKEMMVQHYVKITAFHLFEMFFECQKRSFGILSLMFPGSECCQESQLPNSRVTGLT